MPPKKATKKKSKKKTSCNRWFEHLKAYRKNNPGLTLREAMMAATATYPRYN